MYSSATVSHGFIYNTRAGLKVTIAASTSSQNFLWFDHSPAVPNVWTKLQFYVAGTGATSIRVYFNGGYYTDRTISSAWQLITIDLSSIGNPSTGAAHTAYGNNAQLVFQNPARTTLTLYLSGVSFV
jgi:hypothetical protein